MKEGFYKVKKNGKWIIAELEISSSNLQLWFLPGVEEIFYENEFEQIGDLIELPKE